MKTALKSLLLLSLITGILSLCCNSVDNDCDGDTDDDAISPVNPLVTPISPVPDIPEENPEKIQCVDLPMKDPETHCIDLSNGKPEDFPRHTGFSWYSNSDGTELYERGDQGCCSDRAVLQIIPPCWARSLRIDTTTVNGNGWTFNLGDSRSNNGWAGDSGHETFDAESQVLNGVFRTYTNDYCGSVHHPVFPSYMGPDHSMSLRVTRYGQRVISVPPGNNPETSCWDKCLFRWDTMYLGMNRVVNVFGAGNRVGEGLCKVCLTWEYKHFCK